MGQSRVLNLGRLIAIALVLALFIGLSGQAARAAGGEVEVTKAIQGGLTTVDTGVEFTYLINYKYASTTEDGLDIVLTDVLDSDLSWVGAEVIPGSTVHIAGTNFNTANGTVTWTFIDPLPAGASGQLPRRGLSPNAPPAPGPAPKTPATRDAPNPAPYPTNTAPTTANAACGWNTNITGPSTAQVDSNVTYRVRLDRPNPATGNLNTIAPSRTSVTLPVGVLPADVINPNGGTITSTRAPTNPVIVT